MAIKQHVKGSSIELQVVLQGDRVGVEELKNMVRDGITDMHRHFRGNLIKWVDGTFNSLFITTELLMVKVEPILETLLGIGRPTGNIKQLQTTKENIKKSESHPEKEDMVMFESKKMVEEAYKLRGRLIQSSIHDFTSRLINGKGDNNGKRSGKRK